MRLAMKILMGVLIFAALGCVGQGIIAVMGNAQREPFVITCAELAEAGPDGNGHVTVTDLYAHTDLIVVSGGDRKTHWEEAFIPLLPASDPTNRVFRVLLDTHEINTLEKLEQFKKVTAVTGVINNAVQGPREQAKTLLRNSFPGVDLEKCYVVQHNMWVITRTQGVGLLVLSLMLVAAAVVVAKKMPSVVSAAS